MSCRGPQKASGQARGVVRGVVRTRVAANAIGVAGEIRAVARPRASITGDVAPLRVVEDVEGLGTKFEGNALVNREAFEESHIEVRLPWIANDVSAGGAQGQGSGSGEGSGVEEQGPEAAGGA